jgi:hypothetical protein
MTQCNVILIHIIIKVASRYFKTNPLSQGRKCGGVWGGGSPPPQRNDPVGLKLSAVGLKIMRLFTRGALRSKLNI